MISCEQAYVIAATVLLMLYSLMPFPIAGVSVLPTHMRTCTRTTHAHTLTASLPTQFLVQLNADADTKETNNSFFKKLDNFQRRSPGAFVLFVCDAVSMQWFGVGVGVSRILLVYSIALNLSPCALAVVMLLARVRCRHRMLPGRGHSSSHLHAPGTGDGYGRAHQCGGHGRCERTDR